MLKLFLKFLIDPFAIFWLLLLATLVVIILKKHQLFKWLVPVSVLWFLVISTPLIPTQLLNSLEDRYEPVNIEEFTNPEAEYHILVLGGGHGFDDRLPANALLSGEALGRLNEAIRLHRQLPNSRLIFSGFSATSGRTTQAEMLQRAAVLLGVRKDLTILQREPANTYQEITLYAQNFGSKQPVILITSAYHMPRAVQLSARYDLNVIPSPANFRLKGSRKNRWFGLPATQNIENLDLAISEYAGMAWYGLNI